MSRSIFLFRLFPSALSHFALSISSFPLRFPHFPRYFWVQWGEEHFPQCASPWIRASLQAVFR